MTTQMTDTELRRYAILGAEARLLQIREEAEAIYKVFPELRNRRLDGRATSSEAESDSAGDTQPTGGDTGQTPRPSRMSAAQRRAVSERMKKYWAERRGEAAGTEETRRGGSRRLSAAARKRISDAQKARWAKVRSAKRSR